jgi:phage terminase large subunit
VLHGKWCIDRFETPENAIFYHGLDWGFSVDPNVWVRCYIEGNTLYIDRAVYSYKADYEELIKRMEKEDWDTWKAWKTYADSARPEGVHYLRKSGINVYSVGGKTSIEAGIEYLRTFERIVIHERCREIAHEAQNWKYKIDPKTGDVTPIVVDKYNHGWDAIRYALIQLTKRGIINE